MSESASERTPHEQRLDALIAEYLQAVDEGRVTDQADFLRQHPEFAAELREFFVDVGKIEKVVQPIGSAQSGEVASVGLKIRDYRILEKIGAGGMGTVYLALHMWLEKKVALKILKTDRVRNPQAIARFDREMKAVGKLEHPHIVRAFDAGDEAGTHFLVMEYIAGCDLGRLLQTKGRLEVPLACELIRQAALGLQHAHDHNMVHRDVKPSNLILSAAGVVKVLDLGLAQLPVDAGPADDLTHEGQFVGTWLYMAPEQFLPGRKVDSRSDIFSLGVTFYSFLVGKLPLSLGQAAIHLPAIGTQRADVPPDVQTLLTKMLAPHQDQRIQTMTEVAEVLQVYAAQGSVNILKTWVSRNLADNAVSPVQADTQIGPSTTDEPEVVPPPVQVTPPVESPAVSPNKPPSVDAEAPPKSSRLRVACIMGVGVLLIAGGIWGAGRYLSAPTETTEAPKNSDGSEGTGGEGRPAVKPETSLEPAAKATVVLQAGSGEISLPPSAAVLTGATALNIEISEHVLRGWASPDDSATWKFKLQRPGFFKLELTYAAAHDGEDIGLKLLIGEEQIHKFHLAPTGGADKFQTVSTTIVVKVSGTHPFNIRPTAAVPAHSLAIKSFRLIPVGG